jgi:hypothetical protein
MEDVSGSIMDISGMDISGGGIMDISGMDISGSSIMGISSGSYNFQIEPPAPTVLRLDDLLSHTTVLLQKEAADAAILAGVGNPDMNSLRDRLVAWAVTGFAGSVRIVDIEITPPPQCSDGVARDLADYIQFVSGKNIYEHLALLAEKLPDFRVAFVYMGSSIHFTVSKV